MSIQKTTQKYKKPHAHIPTHKNKTKQNKMSSKLGWGNWGGGGGGVKGQGNVIQNLITFSSARENRITQLL